MRPPQAMCNSQNRASRVRGAQSSPCWPLMFIANPRHSSRAGEFAYDRTSDPMPLAMRLGIQSHKESPGVVLSRRARLHKCSKSAACNPRTRLGTSWGHLRRWGVPHLLVDKPGQPTWLHAEPTLGRGRSMSFWHPWGSVASPLRFSLLLTSPWLTGSKSR